MTTHTPHFDHDVQGRQTNWIGWTKTILLLGLGLDLAFLIVTGILTYYISPYFAWLTYVASGLLIFFGLISAVDLLRGNSHAHHHHHDHDHEHDDECDHDHDYSHHHHDHDDHQHEEITWPILAVIAIPLLLGVLVPAEPLSAASVNGGITTSAVGLADENIAEIPPTERHIVHWLQLIEASDDLSEFNGLPVDLIGFVYREPSYDENQSMIVRFTISCCVADALAIGLPIDISDMDLPEVGAWIRISGTLQVGPFNDGEMPIIQPEVVEPIEIPADPYLYT